MYRRVIPLQVADEYVQGDGVPVGAAGSHDDVALRLAFGPMWAGTARSIVWYDANGENPTITALTTDMLAEGESEIYLVPIPAEPKAMAGEMTMTVKGVTVSGSKETTATLTAAARFRVLESSWDPDAEESADITPTQAQQFQAEIEGIKSGIAAAMASGSAEAETQRGENEQSRQEAESTRETNEAARRAAEKIREQNEAARVEAEKNRKDGTTFTPAVSEEGVLSWSNTDGKPNPESRNIRGPTGAPGVVISEEEPTDPSHPAWVDPSGDEMVELLEPVEKTDAMTQPVGADGEGKLWTEPTGGGKLWRPNVTEAGMLSWEASESETAPDAQNIKGPAGSDGITPRIGGNGNWYIGDTDTGLPSRGAQGATGPAGADGKDGGQGPKGDPGDDYVLTDADKAEIVQATLAALPTWTGGSY